MASTIGNPMQDTGIHSREYYTLKYKIRNVATFLHEIHSDLSLQGNQKLIMDKIEDKLIHLENDLEKKWAL